MQPSVDQCRHLLTIAEPILDGLDDSHRALEPVPGVKTAGWLVGHLTVSADFARQWCGRPSLCPAGWGKAFAPGTQPSRQAEDYPPMAVLISTFHAIYRDLIEAAPLAAPHRLAAPNPYVPARGPFPTTRDFVLYLMSGHLGYHLGQLSGWRAAAGLGSGKSST